MPTVRQQALQKIREGVLFLMQKEKRRFINLKMRSNSKIVFQLLAQRKSVRSQGHISVSITLNIVMSC